MSLVVLLLLFFIGSDVCLGQVTFPNDDKKPGPSRKGVSLAHNGITASNNKNGGPEAETRFLPGLFPPGHSNTCLVGCGLETRGPLNRCCLRGRRHCCLKHTQAHIGGFSPGSHVSPHRFPGSGFPINRPGSFPVGTNGIGSNGFGSPGLTSGLGSSGFGNGVGFEQSGFSGFPGAHSGVFGHPSQHHGKFPSQHHGKFPSQQFGQFPGQQFGQFPGQQFGQFPGQQFGQFPGQQFGQFPGQQFGQFPGQHHGQFPSHHSSQGLLVGIKPGVCPGGFRGLNSRSSDAKDEVAKDEVKSQTHRSTREAPKEEPQKRLFSFHFGEPCESDLNCSGSLKCCRSHRHINYCNAPVF